MIHPSKSDFYGSTVAPPFINVQPLPPVPAANIPLNLEGRGLVLSYDLEQQPSMDDWSQPMNDWYSHNYSENQIYENTYSSNDVPNESHNDQNIHIGNNPRVVIGPMPVPPSYDDARNLPYQTPIQPPLPPPVSITQQSMVTSNEEEKVNVKSTPEYVEEQIRALVDEHMKK